MTHDFEERLAWSQRGGDEPFWDAAYRQFFPNLVSHTPCCGDVASQRMGIDRLVMLGNGQALRIDEKKRSREYGDFLIEYLSNDRTGAPGWIAKDLFIDFLAYAFLPSRMVYFFPWLPLRRAWSRHGKEWIAQGERRENGFRLAVASNRSYRTHSVCVPRAVLYRAVAQAGLVRL